MSDIEAPPAKMSKYEYLEEGSADDGMDEGQEEWLSEGILTDDDYPATEQAANDWKNSDNSQDTTLPSTNCDSTEQLDNTLESQDNLDLNREETSTKTVEQNIEETLNNLDSTRCDVEVLPDELNAFLIRKTDGKVLQDSSLISLKEDTKDNENETKRSEDDGNDTDDLLRMLSEDNDRSKKLTKTTKDVKSPNEEAPSSDDDDDSEIFETAKAKSIKLAKNVLIKKYPATKAVPEDMSEGDDETDASSDEGDTMKKMFGVIKKQSVASKSTTKSSITIAQSKPILKEVVNNKTNTNKLEKPQTTALKQYANKNLHSKSILKTVTSPNKSDKVGSASDEVRTLVTYKSLRKSVQGKPESAVKYPKKIGFLGSMEKITVGSSIFKPSGVKSADVKVKSVLSESKVKPAEVKPVSAESKMKPAEVKAVSTESKVKPAEVKAAVVKMVSADVRMPSTELKTKPKDLKIISDVKMKSAEGRGKSQNVKLNSGGVKEKSEPDELINEDEFLEGEDIDLDEQEFAEESDLEEDTSRSQQRIMRPERMDEEVLTDEESRSEDGSLYDELPSSESDDIEDWFTLDIRAERAGDYIPLLGSKAKELLLQEKRRVSSRVANLRSSLTALTESGRRQAEQLRDATMTLAELDDMLKAS